MTKEELEREIKNYIDKNCKQWETDGLTVDDIVRVAVLDFAEPRKTRIAELEDKLANADYQLEGRDNEIRKFEKENKVLTQNLEDTEIINAELKKKLKEELKTIADKDLSFVARFDALEKENAELKDDNKIMADNYSKMEQKFYDNLTKAKELLKKLLVHSKRYIWIADDNNKPIMQKEIAEAEQFLKE